MAGLHFPITADNRNFMSAIHEITSGVQDATRQIEASGGSIDRVISMIKTGVASVGIGLGFKELVSQVTDTRDQFQKLEITFKTFLGSEEEASKLMQQMVHTAAITPFDLAGVADGAKNLLAFGVAAEDVNKTIISLGDIAAGLSQPLGDIIYLYGTTISKPKMDTQDLMQMMGRGIPIAKELAKQFGVAENKVRDLITAGKVTGDVVKKAFESMTAEGSMFGGLMEAQSQSIGGKIANIQDSIDEMFNEIGRSSEGIINTSLDATSKIVENWESVLLILGDVAAAYGVQKAILALDSAFTRSATNYGYDIEIEQLKALIPAKEEEVRTALQQAVASGNLTEAKAAEIAALREEVQAQLEALTAKEAAAKSEEASALIKVKAAEEEVKAIDEEMEAIWDKVAANMASMTAEEREAATIELETLETMRNEAANLANAASEEAKAAAVNTAAASEARETLETKINTAQTAGNSAATGILTIAKEKLAIAISKVNAAMKANQFALITGAVIALGYGIYKLATYQTDAEKSTRRLNEAYDKAESSAAAEALQVKVLFDRLKQAKEGTEEYDKIKTKLYSKYGDILNKIGSEKEALHDLTKAYKLVTDAIEEKARAQALDSYLEEEGKNYQEKRGKSYDKIHNAIKDKYGEDYAKALSDDINDVIDGKKVWKKDFLKKFENTRRVKTGKAPAQIIKTNDLESYTNKASIDRADYTKIIDGAYDKFGIERDAKEEASKKSAETRDGSTIDKEIKDKKEELTKYKTGTAEWKKIDAEITALEKERLGYGDYDRDHKKKKSSGLSSEQIASKQTEAHQKLLDLMKRQAEERLKLKQDYEYQEWQNRIDLMEEGEEKVLAQMALDHKKERTALTDQKDQDIKNEVARQKALFDAKEDEKAAGNKKYAKQIFDPGDDIEETVMDLNEVNKEIKALEENIESLSNQDVIDTDALEDAKSDLAQLNKQKANLEIRLGDISPEEITKILDQYNELSIQLLQRQKKSEEDLIKEAKQSRIAYLKEFGKMEEKRLAITEEWNDKIDKAENEAQRKLLSAQRDKELKDFDVNWRKKTGDLKKLFTDPVNMTKARIKEALVIAENYLKQLNENKEQNIDEIEEVTNRVKDLRNEYENIDTSNISSGLESCVMQLVKIHSLQKKIQEMKERNEDTSKEEAELERSKANLQKSLIATGIGEFSNAIVRAADAMQQLADITGDIDLGNTASMMASFGQNLQAAGQGFSSGGWIGAIIGGVSDILEQTITSLAEHKLLMAQYALEHKKFLNELEIMNLRFDSDSWDSVFGVASISKAMDAAAKAQDIYKKYDEVVNKKFKRSLDPNQDGDKNYDNLGVSIFTGVFGWMNQKESYKYWTEIEAMKKGFTELQAMAINTTHYSGWMKFWGHKDKYSSLKDLAPQLWDKNGDFNADAAKKFLEVNNQISAEQRQQIQNAIDLKDAYDEAIAALDAEIGDNMSNLADSITDVIYNSVVHGTDAWVDFKRVGRETIVSLGKELVKNFLISEYLNSYTEKLRKAYLLGDPVETQKQVASIFNEMMIGVKDLSQQTGEILADFYHENGINNISFFENFTFDSIQNDFKSLLSDMESDASDFSDSFETLLKDAIVNGLMDSKYNALLQEWYDDFAQAMDDGELSKEEAEALRRRRDEIIQQAMEDKEALKSIVGNGAYSQSATSGGWETMGQDTADELNGRFTALTELNSINNSLVAEGNTLAIQILESIRSLSDMAMSMTIESENSTLMELRDMMFLSTGYLEDISKHTKHLLLIESGIDNLKDVIAERL